MVSLTRASEACREGVRIFRCHLASSEAQPREMLDSVGTPIGTMPSLLGHSTPEITRDIYLHAIQEEQRRAVENVERLVFGPKFGLRRKYVRNSSLKIKK